MQRLLSITCLLISIVSCSSLSLKDKVKNKTPIRLGVLNFRITAPIKKLKDIQTLEEGKNYLSLEDEIKRREAEAKQFFIRYMNTYYKDVETVDIPEEKIQWKDDLEFSHKELRALKEEYNLDAVVAGEIPWYGKTNIMWPIIGLTADIASETLIIGLVTHWNGPLLLANLGWELVTNTPLWFGGAWFFGQAYKPVTINTKMIDLRDEIKEYEKDFEVTKSAHMLQKIPEKERKKIENQLDASLKKALKEIAIDLNKK